MNSENKQPIFPYVSYPAFKAFIAHLHDTVVTDQIDNTMMPPKMSGGVRSAVTSTLKSLNLIDDQSNTAPELKELVVAYNNKEWPDKIKELILSVYSGTAKGIDLKSATRKQIEGMFEGASPQMKDKYIRFYLSANKDAGVEYSPHLKIRRRLPKRRTDTTAQKIKTPAQKKPKPHDEETPKNDVTPPDMYDQPIPIVSDNSCYIRIPRNITKNQVVLVKAAVAFIEAIANQNEKSE